MYDYKKIYKELVPVRLCFLLVVSIWMEPTKVWGIVWVYLDHEFNNGNNCT